MLRQAKQMISTEHIEDEDGRIYITWREHRRGASEMRDALPECAEHVQQFGGESPLPNLMEVKG